MNQSSKTILTGVAQVVVAVLMLPINILLFLGLYLPFLCTALLAEFLMRFTKYGNVNFYPKEEFPWTKRLEENWRVIRSELDSLLTHVADVPNIQDVSDQKYLTQDDKWKSYIFNVGGKMYERSCLECPETAKLLATIPDLYFAQFSILMGNKHLKAHHGLYKGVLNCHLALLVPPNPKDCRLRVEDEYANWEEGEIFIFDDRKEHEAWNDSDSIRVVLIIHVIRPLPFPLSTLNRLLLAITSYIHPATKSVWKRQAEWFKHVDEKRKHVPAEIATSRQKST